MATDWDLLVEDGNSRTTLRDFVRDQYQYRSDSEIARILQRSGFSTTTEAVKSLRNRSGWAKKSGVASIDETVNVKNEEDITLKQLAPSPGLPTQGLDTTALLNEIKDRPRTLRALSAKFDRSEQTIARALNDLKAAHYNIVEVASEILLSTKSPPEIAPQIPKTLADQAGMRVKMGWISDLHGGSTAQQITNLNAFIKLAYERGVRHILISGDLVAGDQVYRGQIHDLFAIGADRQLRVILFVLPKMPGLIYYVIGGNHDYSYVKASGYNIVADFASRRDDVIYLGFDMADVPITDRVDVRLWHPSGGVPYALSYRLQKGLEQITMDELNNAVEVRNNPKLRGVAAGHLHVCTAIWPGPIFAAQVGCFEGQTNYLKRRAMFPKIGGFIVEWKLTDGGLVQECTPKFIPFLEIKDDYKNYPVMLAQLSKGGEDKPDPLFVWTPDEE